MTERVRGDRPERVRGDKKPAEPENKTDKPNGNGKRPERVRIPGYLRDLSLTDKQYLFALYWSESENGTQSARDAGYSYAGAGVQACLNLDNPNIREAIQRIRQMHIDKLARIDAQMEVKTQSVLKQLASIGNFDPDWIYEDDAGIEIVETMISFTDEEGNTQKELRSYEKKVHPSIKPINEWPEAARLALKKLKVGAEGKITDVEFYDKLEANRLLGSWLHDMFGKGKPTDDDEAEKAAQKIQQFIQKISGSVPRGIRQNAHK